LTRYEQQEIDYITFQPYSEYFPSIQYLRENQIKSPWGHLQATSELSRKILRNVAGVLILLILFALSDIDSNFTWENMIVVLLTLGQAFFIEYLVHWRWNRFNLSFDSVAKYFGETTEHFLFICFPEMHHIHLKTRLICHFAKHVVSFSQRPWP
jgi:hypothetical protein